LKTFFNFEFIGKVVILMLSPWPEGDTRKHQSDYVFVFMHFRFIFVAEAIFNYSQYKTRFVNKICTERKVVPSNWFIFKLFLVRNPVVTVMSLFFFSIFMFATIVLCFEVEYFMKGGDQGLMHPFFTAVYFMMITLTTIGYGDYSPSTVVGRLVVMIAAVWGAILLSLFVTVVSGLFSMTGPEEDSVQLADLSREAARVIAKAF
jgi:hypothetical protein